MKYQAHTPFDQKIQIVKEKHAMLPDILSSLDIDCWMVVIRETAANPDPVQNLVIGGEVVWTACFIFSYQDSNFRKIAIVGNFDADFEKNKGIWDEVIPYTKSLAEVLIPKFAELKPKKIALNYSKDEVMSDGLSHGLFLTINEMLDGFVFVSAEKIIQTLRSRKSQTEVELITNAAKLTEEINGYASKNYKSGMTEIEIQNVFHSKMDELGVIEAWQREGCPSVDAGPDKVFGHVGPSKLKIREGGTLHNDFGVKLSGYTSDIQRMWYFGKKEELPDELAHAFKTVHGAISAAAEFIKPGVKGVEVDTVARNHVISQGYKEFEHALGHQVGTLAHDGGALLGPKWERYGDLPDGIIEKNNVFTLELYVKTENHGMVSLEEMILITDDGCKFMVPRQEDYIYMDL